MSSRDRLADKWIRLSMQSLLSKHRPQATRTPCLNSQNHVHGRKLVSVEGGDCSKRSNFGGCPTKNGPSPKKKFPFFSRVTEQLSVNLGGGNPSFTPSDWSVASVSPSSPSVEVTVGSSTDTIVTGEALAHGGELNTKRFPNGGI